MTYEIQHKQRSGKWACRLTRDSLVDIQKEWRHKVDEMLTRAPDARRRLRCRKDGIVIWQWTPPELQPPASMTALHELQK